MRTLLVLVLLAAAAHADPLQVTKANLEHNATITVAPGDKQVLILWEEQEAKDREIRHLAAAIVDDAGKLVAGPTRYLDGGSLPNNVNAVWTGSAFLVAVCNEHWGDQKALKWGTLDGKLAFTPGGEWKRKAGDGYSFYCSHSAPSGDGGMVLAVTSKMEGDDSGEMKPSCGAWHMKIEGAKLTDGRRIELCDVEAIDKDYLIGSDAKGHTVAATPKKKLVTLNSLIVGGKIASGTFVAVTDDGLLTFTPGAKAVATKPVKLAKGPLKTAQIDHVFAIGDQVGLEAKTPTGLELAIYKRDGSLARADVVSKAKLVQHRCTATAGAVFCAWTSHDDKTFTGDVFVQRLAIP